MDHIEFVQTIADLKEAMPDTDGKVTSDQHLQEIMKEISEIKRRVRTLKDSILEVEERSK